MELYHRPTCTKSRSALQILKELGYAPCILDYGKTGLSKKELNLLFDQIQNPEISIIRKRDAIAAGIAKDKLIHRDDIIAILYEHPGLMERPILRLENKAWILRPDTETLLKNILQSRE